MAHGTGSVRSSRPRGLGPATLLSWLWLAVAAGDEGQVGLTAYAREDYQAGHTAYAQQRYTEAARIWMPLALEGDLRAQFGLATLYAEGNGLPQDHAESAYWFARAADQGLPAAQFNLGNAYHHGRGVPQNDGHAARWWRRAAEQGFAPAQFNLGTQYLYGRGVARDEGEALDWYRRAAAGGHAGAQRIVTRVEATATPKPAPEPAAAGLESAAAAGLHGSGWVLARDPAHFTLQLVAMSEPERIPRFVEQHRLDGELAVFSFERDGRRYFALIRGDYPDRAAARRAAAALPLEIRAGQPWPRALAEIQALIRAGAPP